MRNDVRGFSLMIHGGAGSLDELEDAHTAAPYRLAITQVLVHGRTLLDAGASALDVVEECAALLEDDPLFNAGRGSVLNASGYAELDAAIMDGRDLAAGAVAAVRHVGNPIRLARLVMQHSGHVLLAGEGALRFAAERGVPRIDDRYFQLPARVAQLERVRRQAAEQNPDLVAGEPPHGTIGAIARDLRGDLAAATSTGGMVNKHVGRVGDSPLIGAGVYADNSSCAVSSTGRGEDFMRSVLAKNIADRIELAGQDVRVAVAAAIESLGARLQGQGGVIAIGRDGRCAAAHNTRHMIHGWIEHAGEAVIRF